MTKDTKNKCAITFMVTPEHREFLELKKTQGISMSGYVSMLIQNALMIERQKNNS